MKQAIPKGIRLQAFVLALGIIFVLPFFALGDSYEVLYVDDDASGEQDGSKEHPFSDISEALEKVDDNDETKVYVAEGKYKDNFNIPEDAQVIGAGADKTIIESDDDDDAVVYMEHGTKLSGVTVEEGRYGVMVKKNARADIYDCVIRNNDREGVFLLETESNKDRYEATIANTTIKNNGRSGVYGKNRPIVIVESIIRDNDGDGITIEDSTKLWVEDTHIKDNEKSGIYSVLDRSDVQVIDCILEGNDREGMEINAYGADGYVKVDNTNIWDNERYGIARVQRAPGVDGIWGKVELKYNRIEGNEFGAVSHIVFLY